MARFFKQLKLGTEDPQIYIGPPQRPEHVSISDWVSSGIYSSRCEGFSLGRCIVTYVYTRSNMLCRKLLMPPCSLTICRPPEARPCFPNRETGAAR